MIIPLDKLLVYNKNRYALTKAMMETVGKVGNIDEYPEEDLRWKIVPNVINLVLDKKLQFDYNLKKEAVLSNETTEDGLEKESLEKESKEER